MIQSGGGGGVVAGLPILQIFWYSTDISCFKILRADFFQEVDSTDFFANLFFTFS